MRFATVFTLGTIAVLSTSASNVVRVTTVPPCYDTCVEQADTRGCASLSDTKCLCNDPTYVSETVKCFEQVCKGTNLEDAVSIGESVCLAAGVTLTASTATPTSSPKKKAAAIRHANLNSFVGLAAVGLVALATIY